ncbi:MAG: FAD-dependent thymidylate synthase [Candidatus Kariarchaeaceae archaeon]|jgi:hypothetical protein
MKKAAELLSWTNNPIETIYCLWEKSKRTDFNLNPDQIKDRMESKNGFSTEVYFTVLDILEQDVPVLENVDFVFMLYGDSISHREQMVRHRIGVHFGDNFGVDIIPDLADSTWWSQSMQYIIPETVCNNLPALKIYDGIMKSIQETYKNLVDKCGIPMEDARNVLPLGTTMDISWKVNLKALLHILGKRSCWILQFGLWEPIVTSMIDELCEKVDPIFREIFLPPCFKKGKFVGCVYQLENKRRVSGEDQLPVCSLYYHHHLQGKEKVEYEDSTMYFKTIEMSEKYAKLWKRNPFSGEKE